MFASIFLGILFGYGLRVFSEHVGFAIISAAALFVVFIWPGLLIRFLNGLDAQAESELAKAHEKRLKDLGFEDLVKRYGL